MFIFNKKCCHKCKSYNLSHYKNYKTSHNGSRELYKCDDCGQIFSETKGSVLEGLRTPVSLIISVFKARSNGLSFNATCETFGISKNTLLDWEWKFSDLKDVFLVYALLHTFISMIIEGDEAYTKIGKNLPVEDCEGWMIVLMERASRFILELRCGKKDRTLFFHAIQILRLFIERTGDITLLTDGERRYGNILFEICQEVIRNGKSGRPPKVLRQGVKVRLKNKGDQSRKRGRKRPKYEAPHREHPQTRQDISNSDVHANHVEAFNASMRRRNSACRRKTNTYAKSKNGLQRTLDILWIVHNFIRKHFTTKQVPAVALGILKEGLSWEQVLKFQRPTHI